MNVMKRKNVLLRLRPEHYERFKAQAVARDLPLTRWLLQAALAYEAKGARFGKKREAVKQFEPCSLCGKRHDKQEHFR